MWFDQERAMWAELRNADSRFLVASGDWTDVISEHSAHSLDSKDHWDEQSGTCRWSDIEARSLAGVVEAHTSHCCEGRLTLDLAGPVASGSRSVTLDDGLTSEERTARLIAFLREGAFTWRYVVEPWRPAEP